MYVVWLYKMTVKEILTLQKKCILCIFFDIFLTVHLSIFISVINQLDAHFCFAISLFHASTCYEHIVLETRRGMK